MAKHNMGIKVEDENPHGKAVHQLRAKIGELNNNSKRLMEEGQLFYDKEGFKGILRRHRIKTPETYMYVSDPEDAHKAISRIKELKLSEFVIKPNNQSQGRNITVYSRKGNHFVTPSGDVWYYEDIEYNIKHILNTTPAMNKGVILEERIHTHPDLNKWNPIKEGIVDMRLYVIYHMVDFAKMRVPSKGSKGLANTGQGAIAFHVSEDGMILNSNYMVNTVTKHPDTNQNLEGEAVPFWDKMTLMAVQISKLFHLKFHSVDLTVGLDGECICGESERIPWLGSLSTAGCNHIMTLFKKYSGEVLD